MRTRAPAIGLPSSSVTWPVTVRPRSRTILADGSLARRDAELGAAQRPADRAEVGVIDRHVDLAHRVRDAVEPPAARLVGRPGLARGELPDVAGALLELDGGTDLRALDRLPLGVDDDPPDRPRPLQLGGEPRGDRRLVLVGRPARPVRPEAGDRDVQVEPAGVFEGSRRRACPRRPPSRSSRKLAFRTKVPRRICSAVGRVVPDLDESPRDRLARPAGHGQLEVLRVLGGLRGVLGGPGAPGDGRGRGDGAPDAGQRDEPQQDQAGERPRAERGPDRPVAVQEPADAGQARGPRVEPEDPECRAAQPGSGPARRAGGPSRTPRRTRPPRSGRARRRGRRKRTPGAGRSSGSRPRPPG